MSTRLSVGIITFHNASNYGAALQAFATYKACIELGADVEVIDYVTDYRANKYSALQRIIQPAKKFKFFSALKMLVASPGVISRNLSFSNFYKENIVISQRRFSTPDELKSFDFDYTTVIAGSDQIWSHHNNGSDFSYLLDFVGDDVNKVSYASSFGIADIPLNLENKYRESLNRINFLSTREETGVKLIKELTGKDAFLALDPVLLHDRNFWSQMARKPKRLLGNKFDLYYLNSNRYRSHKIFTNDFVEGVDKICIGSFKLGDVFDNNFKLRNNEGPLEFLYYIENARYIYTTSFHAVVFSLIFNKPFFVFLSGNEGRDSRIKQVLGEFDLLSHALLDSDCDLHSLECKPDFTNFNERWSSNRSDCLSFLENALKGDVS
ncbi:polysaccharide pyruvyl transferase family protein [Vibrio alfacsensis]|uniref:polysaccharide pyruvyl transferase family protein n=1 Tax=Vibrio alfacsensis TaxID=1074311 RepID=UPI001BEFDADC|nr:polysaccharide pyruvyl transferase family protein [Vibrio alfacsensis]BCN23021.1 hypothetical protein VYA_02130 [Vibrio alfacsensis]